MFDFGSITGAKKKAENNYQKHAGDYFTEFNTGLAYMKEFVRNPDDNILRRAAEKFSAAIICKRSSVEPYCYLAYIFFIFDRKETSIEYFKYAESIDKSFHLLAELREMIYSN